MLLAAAHPVGNHADAVVDDDERAGEISLAEVWVVGRVVLDPAVELRQRCCAALDQGVVFSLRRGT